MLALLLAAGFSVTDVLSMPFVDTVTASPDGTVLVWRVDASGVHNLYTNAGGTIHKITPYATDDGQDIADVQITQSNDAVVYLHGGVDDNADDGNPNPLSLIPPPERAIFIVPLAGGEPVQIGIGNNVALSPAGDAMAYTTVQGQMNVVSLTKSGDTYSVGKPDPLPIRGAITGMVWSPDGSRLALTNARGDHSFVVIYTPAKHSYVYATPDFTHDGFPSWSPDGSRVAFVRTPGTREDNSPYLDPPDMPWSIWIANAVSGNAREIWEARRGMGAQFYPTDSDAQLWWMRGDYIAFPWEGDGWRHLYAVSANGGIATRLTAGSFEAETVAESLDRTHLLYATNEDDIDRRHIWMVGLEAHPRALTSGTNSQWAPTPLANGGYAYVDGGYNAPPVLTIAGHPAKTLVAVATPANFPATQLVRPQLVTYRAPDGLLIHAQLFVPRSIGTGKAPAIVFDHGGSRRQMLPGFHYMEPYTHLYEMNQYLVSRGFVVLSINYRSGIMYGHDFRMAKNCCWRGASEYQDVLAGGRWLQKQPEVDPKRIGIYGLSYGGLLTALALARNSDIFKAGADFSGVHNWATLFDRAGRTVGTPEQRAVAEKSTAIGWLNMWRSPVLISQGDDDRNVAFSQGVDLATRLRSRGIHVETLVFPNETHEPSVWAHLVQQYQTAAAFLVKELQPPQAR
ncbi:MAG TPA: prolyl oligopeptidase family serine peptidase [Candidatus Aquilonibacter sp.]